MAIRLKHLSGLLVGAVVQLASLSSLGFILARVMPVGDFGIVRTVTSYMMALTLLGHITLQDAVSAYVAGSDRHHLRAGYVSAGLFAIFVISSTVSIAFHVLVVYSGYWSGPLRTALGTVTLILPFETIAIAAGSVLNAAGQIRSLVIFTALGGLVPLAIIAPSAAHWALPGWIAARMISCVVFFLAACVYMRQYLSFRDIRWKNLTELLGFSRLQFVSGALSTVMNSGDVIALERMSHNVWELGQYGLATLVTKAMAFIPGTLGRLYFLEIASPTHSASQRWRAVARLLTITVFIGVSFAALLIVFGPLLIHRVYGDRFAESSKILVVAGLGTIFTGLWASISTVNVAQKRPGHSALVSVTGAVAAVTLLYSTVKGYGGMGAAWSMLIANAMGCLVGGVLIYRRWRAES